MHGCPAAPERFERPLKGTDTVRFQRKKTDTLKFMPTKTIVLPHCGLLNDEMSA
jgi:hypothetical protein